MLCDSVFIAQLNAQTFHFDTLPSTQTYATEALKAATLTPPFCIHAFRQSEGIGSRGNAWEAVSGALTFSFALPLSALPKDLKLESSSIFFGTIAKEYLAQLGSNAWLKYPNDLYIDNAKIGGILTQKVCECLVCGIGINLYADSFGALESSISAKIEAKGFIKGFFDSFAAFSSWGQVFSLYSAEFHRNKDCFFHYKDKLYSLSQARLNEDGSLNIDGDDIYSLR